MSSSPTAPTSTTVRRPPCVPELSRLRVVVACGALARPRAIASVTAGPSTSTRCRRAAQPAALIAVRYAGLAVELAPAHDASRSATPTAAPTAPSTRCATASARALPGLHCYDLLDGRARRSRPPRSPAPTSSPTSSSALSSARGARLGLNRWPELRDDYFRHYRRVVWLAQRADGRAPPRRRAGRRAARPAARGRRAGEAPLRGRALGEACRRRSQEPPG